jgi:hypothetical protein
LDPDPLEIKILIWIRIDTKADPEHCFVQEIIKGSPNFSVLFGLQLFIVDDAASGEFASYI